MPQEIPTRSKFSNGFPEGLVTDGGVRRTSVGLRPGVALLVSMSKFGEIFAHIRLNFLGGWMDHTHEILNITEILVVEFVSIVVEYKRR